MAFRILTNRDLSVDDLKNIVANSNGKSYIHFIHVSNCIYSCTVSSCYYYKKQQTNACHMILYFISYLFAEQTSVTFDQFCCILTEFRNMPVDNQRRVWDILVGKAAALLYTIVSPVSRILCQFSKLKKNFLFFYHFKINFLFCFTGRPKGVTRCDSTSSPEVMVGGVRDVYLGGSCGNSTWREQTAIPLLK